MSPPHRPPAPPGAPGAPGLSAPTAPGTPAPTSRGVENLSIDVAAIGFPATSVTSDSSTRYSVEYASLVTGRTTTAAP